MTGPMVRAALALALAAAVTTSAALAQTPAATLVKLAEAGRKAIDERRYADALTSFTVAQRTREIGICIALGAQPRRVMLNVFGRAAWQIAAGVLVGSILSGAASVAIGPGLARAAPLLLAVAAIMALVGLSAAFGPARRGVRIQAIDALRADT